MAAAGDIFCLEGRRVWVAGHRGLVGSALLRRLAGIDCTVLTVPRIQVDLTDQANTHAWVRENRPEVVIVAAAKVGGIEANRAFPVDFLAQNLAVSTNILAACHAVGVAKLLFLGSSCIYPRLAPQPIPESALLTGPLEPTNEWYAIAKIAAIKMCQAYRQQYGCDFITAMPTNLYGPNDNFHPQHSHVLPGLMRRCHEAKLAGAPRLVVWGTGTPRRELMHVDDLADACIFLLRHYSSADPVNVGTGTDLSIRDLATLLVETVGFRGELVFDAGKPDGMPRKMLDVGRLHAMGWRHRIPLAVGVAETYRWYVDNLESLRAA